MKRFSTSSDVTRCVRPRRISALTIAALRRANPNLDDEQGPRALLLPPSANTAAALERHLDEAADALASEFDNRPAQVAHPELLARESDAPVPASMLQLYALDDSSAMLSAALRAGFFCFGSEFHMPGRPIEERGLLNLELAGPAIEPCGDEIGGRLVLDLTPGSGQSLVVGKRSIKTVASATSTPSAAAPSSSGGFQYRLTVNRAFDRSWATIVASHGVDWLGFSRIREAYHRLHTQQPAPWDARSAASASVASAASAVSAAVTTAACDTPRVLSIELWALKGPLARSKPSAPDGTRQVSPELWDPAAVATSAVLVSAEVGVLVGTCYTCLSLHADTAAYPRSDHVRAQAAVMLLRRAGVTLVDVGTTAEYYRVLFGFRRVSRAQFLAMWRARRGSALHHPAALAHGCEDVRALLEEAREAKLGDVAPARRRATAADQGHTAGAPSAGCAARAAGSSDGGVDGGDKAERSVKVGGLPVGVSAAALGAAFARCGAVQRASVVEGRGFGVLIFEGQAAAAAALCLDSTAIELAGIGGAPILSVAPAPARAKGAKHEAKMQRQQWQRQLQQRQLQQGEDATSEARGNPSEDLPTPQATRKCPSLLHLVLEPRGNSAVVVRLSWSGSQGAAAQQSVTALPT